MEIEFIKLKRIVGKPYFSDQFEKVIKSYKKWDTIMDIMQQYACLVANTIMVYCFGFLFNCTRVGQAPGSMKAWT